MRILVLGATGPTGKLLVPELTRAGHNVTVLVRDPARLASAAGIRVMTGDATSPADLESALTGQDALISVLGGGRSMASTIASDAARVFIAAAEKLGVKRVEVLSAYGSGNSISTASGIQRLMFGMAMKKVFADKAIADDLLRVTSLDWTIFYPVTLNNKPASGHLSVGESVRMKGAPTVSRADVAQVLVASLSDKSAVGRSIIISSRKE